MFSGKFPNFPSYLSMDLSNPYDPTIPNLRKTITLSILTHIHRACLNYNRFIQVAAKDEIYIFSKQLYNEKDVDNLKLKRCIRDIK